VHEERDEARAGIGHASVRSLVLLAARGLHGEPHGHVAGHPPQSAAQFEQVSPSEQMPSPHCGHACVALWIPLFAAGPVETTWSADAMCRVVK